MPSKKSRKWRDPNHSNTETIPRDAIVAHSRTYASVLTSKAVEPPSLISHGYGNLQQNADVPSTRGNRPASAKRNARTSSCDKSNHNYAATGTTLGRSHSSVSSAHNEPTKNARKTKIRVTTASTTTKGRREKNNADVRPPVSTAPPKTTTRGDSNSRKIVKRDRPKNSGKLNRSLYSSLSTLETSICSPDTTEKRFSQPVVIPFGDFLASSSPNKSCMTTSIIPQKLQLHSIDETRPIKVGKCREAPKTKRPSRVKRAILAERSMRRCKSAPGHLNYELTCTKDASASTSESPQSTKLQVKKAIHTIEKSQVSKEQEDKVAQLLGKLSDFQDRAYVKYAHATFHRKRTKRFVCGMREVLKHLRLKNLLFIFLARNLEGNATDKCYALKDTAKTPESDVNPPLPILEDILQQIWTLATHVEPITPIIITQTRQKLARLCHKPGRVSVVGVLSAAGAEDLSKALLSMDIAINMPPRKIDQEEASTRCAVVSNGACDLGDLRDERLPTLVSDLPVSQHNSANHQMNTHDSQISFPHKSPATCD